MQCDITEEQRGHKITPTRAEQQWSAQRGPGGRQIQSQIYHSWPYPGGGYQLMTLHGWKVRSLEAGGARGYVETP